MTNLISITNTNGLQTVSARELHEKLVVKAKFADWIKRMIDYGFEEGKDYLSLLKNEKRETGATHITEYFITVDMAKEICMIQRSEIGKKIRQYFIECEKQLREETPKVLYARPVEEVQLERAQLLTNLIEFTPIDTYKQILAAYATKELSGQFLLPLPKAPKVTFTATQLANEFGVSIQKIGSIANANNVKVENNGEWIWDRAKSGKQVKNFVYNQNGHDMIQSLLGE